MPFAIFASALQLFAGDRAALFLFRFIAASGIAVAILGLVQFLFYPGYLLFEPRAYPMGGVTGTFINRNTAATYFGLVLIAAALQFVASLRSYRRRHGAQRRGSEATSVFLPLFWGLGSLVTLTALMLTQSRAGIASSLLGLAVSGVLTAIFTVERTQHHTSRHGRRTASIWVRVGAGFVALALVVGTGVAFGGRVLLRAELLDDQDGRFCVLPGILQMLRDNWLTGTGLGTFIVAFPAYRDPACGMGKVWNFAHDFYLEGWISLGLPFVLICGAGFLILLTLCIRGIIDRRRFRPVPVAGLGILVLVACHSALDFSIQIPGFAATFASVMAAVSTIALGRSSEASAERT
jgi:hypothetical protein